jgi:exonuclease SbcD
VVAVRVLHTSDWHVGRTFHGADLLTEQEAALTHIAELVDRESVDVVVVAGDIYDRAVPSAEAVRVATRAATPACSARRCGGCGTTWPPVQALGP